MSFKTNAPFDRNQGRNRAVVGQYLTRDQQPTESAAMHLLRLAQEEARRLQPAAQGAAGGSMASDQPPAETPAMETLRRAVKEARHAMPYFDHDRGGDPDRTVRVPQLAARMVNLDIGADHLPDFAAPEANRRNEPVTLAESLLSHARTMQAGAHLLIEPKGRTIETGTGVPALEVVPMGLQVVHAAPFAVVTDPDGDLDPENPGAAVLTPLASVLVEHRIERPDALTNYAFRVALTRREQKDQRDGDLLAALMRSIMLGLAQAADAELLVRDEGRAARSRLRLALHPGGAVMGLRGWFSPRDPEDPAPAVPGNMLPADVLATVRAARIHHAPRPDVDGNPIIHVRAPGLGRFRWTDLDKAADRIADAFPGLTPVQCFRAAQLIETEVGDAAIRDLKRQERRRSWVWDW